jgi:energy-coupling factor transporter ATP-binding protein EcfA2
MPETSNASPLVIENLSCRYQVRSEPALQDISFSVGEGQIALVAGTSGCGKTTLLRCVNGLIPRSYSVEMSGRVLLNGEDFSAKPLAEVSKVVGTVLQDPERQIVGAYVRNEVAFGLENLGIPREEIVERIKEVTDYLGIGDLIDRETFSLSGGEKQKVALAGVLVMRPDILALDEPLANLDPASAQEALRLIRRLADEGKTVLIIEHRVEDVLHLDPDLVIYMEKGKITYMGSAEGMLESADFRAVKLPAQVVIRRVAEIEKPELEKVSSKTVVQGSTLVEFKNVSFHYPEGPRVIHEVNLSIHEGDVIAMLGPNGAGKTTLIKHAIGLLKPTQGNVSILGRDSQELTVAQTAQTVGYVFQSPRHMLFAPSVREELAFGPKNLKFSTETIEENVEHALAVVGLESEVERSPMALSFGQQKRVSIAAILAMRSKLLVMDEPTAGQDFANYMSFMDSVVGLRGTNGHAYRFSAIVFITHDLDLAISFANRILLVSEGRIVDDGPPKDVLADLDQLRKCRIIPTSLLEANLENLERTGGFMRVEALARALTT